MKSEQEVQAQLCCKGTTERVHIFLWVPENHALTWSHLLEVIG